MLSHLSSNRRLHFPILDLGPSVSLGKHPDYKKIPITTVVWSDEIFDTIPQPYETLVRSMKFAIPVKYWIEIKRCAEQGMLEWSHSWSFDTSVIGKCLEVSVAYIKTAFYLLSDCAYDAETNYFFRGPEKRILSQAMLYKFWSKQTGIEPCFINSGCHELEPMTDTLLIEAFGREDYDMICDFYEKVKENQDLKRKIADLKNGPVESGGTGVWSESDDTEVDQV